MRSIKVEIFEKTYLLLLLKKGETKRIKKFGRKKNSDTPSVVKHFLCVWTGIRAGIFNLYKEEG